MNACTSTEYDRWGQEAHRRISRRIGTGGGGGGGEPRLKARRGRNVGDWRRERERCGLHAPVQVADGELVRVRVAVGRHVVAVCDLLLGRVETKVRETRRLHLRAVRESCRRGGGGRGSEDRGGHAAADAGNEHRGGGGRLRGLRLTQPLARVLRRAARRADGSQARRRADLVVGRRGRREARAKAAGTRPTRRRGNHVEHLRAGGLVVRVRVRVRVGALADRVERPLGLVFRRSLAACENKINKHSSTRLGVTRCERWQAAGSASRQCSLALLYSYRALHCIVYNVQHSVRVHYSYVNSLCGS